MVSFNIMFRQRQRINHVKMAHMQTHERVHQLLRDFLLQLLLTKRSRSEVGCRRAEQLSSLATFSSFLRCCLCSCRVSSATVVFAGHLPVT